MKKRLGEILLEAGIINESQLQQALEYQSMWGQRLGSALVAKGFITEEMLMRVLGSTLNMPIVDISRIRIAPDVIKAVPGRLAEKYDLVPIALESKGGGRQTLIIAMADPLNIDAVDQVKFTTGFNIRPVLSTISGIAEALRKYYGSTAPARDPSSGKAGEGKITIVARGGERTIDLTSTTDPGSEEPMQIQRSPGAERRQNAANAAALSNPGTTAGPNPAPANPVSAQPTTRTTRGLTMPGLEGTEARDEVRALVRLMIKKGVFTKDEFLKELQEVMLY